MKVTVVKKDFLNALLIGGSFAGRAKALPILDCVKIKFKRDCINIISSDSENAISKRADFHTSDFEGDICVSYKSLIQYVKLLTGEFIEFVISDDLKRHETTCLSDLQIGSCLLNLFNLNQQHHRSTHFITHSRHTHHICRRHCFLNSLNLKTTFYKWIQYLR